MPTTESFFFYDYETFGLNPREDRIAQFAGIRTDRNFNIIGEPINIYCKPSTDYLPSPDAILVTGITLEEAQEKGLTEAEFAKQIHAEFSEPGTCILGYNNIRFDDEMTRFLFYRTFYDPYAYSWRNGNSRWDLLDVVRATYALRPEGITWPKDDAGMPIFKLEELTKANGLEHEKAHDALSDVYATIALTKLLQEKQPKLFQYYFEHRRARQVETLINLAENRPLLHVSGMFGNHRKNMSVVMPIIYSPLNKNELITIDLMGDMQPLIELPADKIRQQLYTKSEDLPEGTSRIPLKGVHINRCPILAPMGVLKGVEQEVIDLKHVLENHYTISQHLESIRQKLMDIYSEKPQYDNNEAGVEALLYAGFFNDQDREQMNQIPHMNGDELLYSEFYFEDPRLEPLLFLYRAKNHFHTLFEEEQEEFRRYAQARKTILKALYAPRFKELWELYKEHPKKRTILEKIAHYYEDSVNDAELD